jgi:SWI/SNF-related matrix-associated actin-dependent regulator of chromatin subfamily A3
LRDIQIRITQLQNQNSITFEEAGRDEDIFQSPKLVFEKDCCDVQSQEGVSIASMNKKAHFVLRSLSSIGRVRYKGLIPRAKLKEKLDTAARSSGPKSSDLTCSMPLLVFGGRSIADSIAKELSRYCLFLQHPYPMPIPFLYENPQYPNIISSSFSNGALLPPISVETFQPGLEADLRGEERGHDAEDFMALMDNLPRHDYLKEAVIDNRIKTTLLWQVDWEQASSWANTNYPSSHQKEAVDFAMRREGIGDTKPRSLWRLDPPTSGSPVYTTLSFLKKVDRWC